MLVRFGPSPDRIPIHCRLLLQLRWIVARQLLPDGYQPFHGVAVVWNDGQELQKLVLGFGEVPFL
jgi:hypothetical protein